MRSLGTRLVLSLGALACAFLMWAESAMACSCVGEPSTLRGTDAAVTARLIEIRDKDQAKRDADFVYRITRVWKGGNRFRLEEGEELVIRSALDGATCGLPRKKDKRYGLALDKFRGELTASLCSVTSPKRMRQIANSRGSGRAAPGATGCAS